VPKAALSGVRRSRDGLQPSMARPEASTKRCPPEGQVRRVEGTALSYCPRPRCPVGGDPGMGCNQACAARCIDKAMPSRGTGSPRGGHRYVGAQGRASPRSDQPRSSTTRLPPRGRGGLPPGAPKETEAEEGRVNALVAFARRRLEDRVGFIDGECRLRDGEVTFTGAFCDVRGIVQGVRHRIAPTPSRKLRSLSRRSPVPRHTSAHPR